MLPGGSGNSLIYRHYATFYFVFRVQFSKIGLDILDLIQVFVETLDRCFENVQELDLIFAMSMRFLIFLLKRGSGGEMLLETNVKEMVTQIDAI
ncbi:unnamed protein product [Gulo gulo]|uniref:AP complex subunit sigma n=1 Tax=Gulo gulo TaxID=48420 RepID=A0A9X9LK79_GULGU|nr:unnamed protein product [Gulo gulo]